MSVKNISFAFLLGVLITFAYWRLVFVDSISEFLLSVNLCPNVMHLDRLNLPPVYYCTPWLTDAGAVFLLAFLASLFLLRSYAKK